MFCFGARRYFVTKQGLLRLLTLQAHTLHTTHARAHTPTRARAPTHAVQGAIIDRVKPLGACGQVALCAGYAPLPRDPAAHIQAHARTHTLAHTHAHTLTHVYATEGITAHGASRCGS